MFDEHDREKVSAEIHSKLQPNLPAPLPANSQPIFWTIPSQRRRGEAERRVGLGSTLDLDKSVTNEMSLHLFAVVNCAPPLSPPHLAVSSWPSKLRYLPGGNGFD